MPSESIQHALGLHLYQPTDNLPNLLLQDEAEVRRILLSYERIARHAHKYAHVARLHLALSPVLLEQLREPGFIDACRHLADVPAILDGLRSAAAIEFIGTGYRHAPLPLIPPRDWEEQLHNERIAMEATLGRVLKGYAPPAALFTPAMVPALVQAGYEYVLLPATALESPDGGATDPYRVYRLCHQGACIAVVPWDRGFSQAQEFGLDVAWFADEVRNGVALAPVAAAPYLLTTWSDGENGEWFRRLDEEHGFFGQFFSPYMEFCETGEFPVRPVHLSDYLQLHPPLTQIGLRAALPSAADASLGDTGPAARERLLRVAARYWALAQAPAGPQGPTPQALLQARELILRAEDSGYLLGDAAGHEALLGLLDRVEQLLDAKPPTAAPAPPAKPTAKPATPPAASTRKGTKGSRTATKAKARSAKKRPLGRRR